MTIACPDCPATTSGDGQLVHEKTCPFVRAVDERIAADRAWFLAHPWASAYRRPPRWSEIAELKLWGLLPDVTGKAVGRVLVRQLAPGVRSRSYGLLLGAAR